MSILQLFETKRKVSLEEINELISKGYSVDEIYIDTQVSYYDGGYGYALYQTALIYAIENFTDEHIILDNVQALLAAGANPNIRGTFLKTPLMYAAQLGVTDVVQALLDAGAEPNTQDIKGKTALIESSNPDYEMNLDTIKLLLKAGADPNIQDNKGRTALVTMCDYSSVGIEYVSVLLDAGADPNTGFGGPLLGLISYPTKRYNDDILEVMHLLLNRGADPNIKDQSGNTLLMRTFKFTHRKDLSIRIAKVLIKFGADLNIQNLKGHTALMKCDNDIKVTRFLLDAGADPNLRDIYGKTVLMKAIRPFIVETRSKLSSSLFEYLIVLLEGGADPNVGDIFGRTIIMTLVTYATFEQLKKLFKYCDIHAIDNYGRNVINYAIETHIDDAIVKYLLTHGCYPNWNYLHNRSINIESKLSDSLVLKCWDQTIRSLKFYLQNISPKSFIDHPLLYRNNYDKEINKSLVLF